MTNTTLGYTISLLLLNLSKQDVFFIVSHGCTADQPQFLVVDSVFWTPWSFMKNVPSEVQDKNTGHQYLTQCFDSRRYLDID